MRVVTLGLSDESGERLCLDRLSRRFIFSLLFSTLLFPSLAQQHEGPMRGRGGSKTKERKLISSTSDQGINAHHSHPRVNSDRTIDLARPVIYIVKTLKLPSLFSSPFLRKTCHVAQFAAAICSSAIFLNFVILCFSVIFETNKMV